MKWNFLSGTILSVLKVDHKITFLPKFLEFMTAITTSPIFEDEVDETDNQKIVKDILRKCFLYFCGHYDSKANKFFEWYMDQMK